MTTRTEEVRRYSLPGEVTEFIEITGNQYAKRHAARATEGREISTISCLLQVPSPAFPKTPLRLLV